MKERPEDKPKTKKIGLWDKYRGYFDSRETDDTSAESEIVASEPIVFDDYSAEVEPTAGDLIHLLEETTEEVEEDGKTEPESATEIGEVQEAKEAGVAPKTPYQEQLESLDFGAPGNPYLKETISRNIAGWPEDIYAGFLPSMAEELNISVVELKDLFNVRLKELMLQCDFFRATNTEVFIHHILNGDRRYKSQFETQTSNGTLDQEWRSQNERGHFGFPRFDSEEGVAAVATRPIYGYFSPDQNGILNNEGRHPPKNNVHRYGEITVKIKKSVAMSRATISFKDSLSLYDQFPVSPAALPHYSSLFFSKYKYDEEDVFSRNYLIQLLMGDIDYNLFYNLIGWYCEAQFHGGLSVEDVESVHLSLGNELSQREIYRVAAAVEAYNRDTASSIPVIIY